ncbi:hypothetical protein FisN_UnNu074 [Fistulifera solaris]|uniref:Elongator complex protein 5 n=1 Tax=Fistulifera solaris TaxID=1519565 RepID=A0A1Z5JPF5_FISSO|nr:hypothetical protein FisN_UnNu074 [Fistulifera solaris]|eukprot:GAX15923.1 hypothetical protein FisN_UnNu074 [Fistulifera solaris]
MKNENESFAHIVQRLAISSSNSSSHCRLWLLQHESRRIDEWQWQATSPILWFQYMIQQLLLLQHTTTTTAPRITYWSTTTTTTTTMTTGRREVQMPPSVLVIRAGRDPFQWEETTSSSSSSTLLPLHDLSQCLHYFQQQQQQQQLASSWLFIESLQPLLVLHGFHKTWHLLQQWPGTVVLPVLRRTGGLTDTQHRMLEDAAWGVLCTQQNPAVFLRKGIRESSNVLRQTIPYRVRKCPSGEGLQLQLVSNKDDENDNDNDDNDNTPPEATISLQQRGKKKVSLHFENDDDKKMPRIFLQENDPEHKSDNVYYYSDEEDEDPDGDLDL